MNASLFDSLFEEAERRPLTVSELNSQVRAAVERQFASVWVEGEVVNFTAASSGHWYFNLNDGKSQFRCVCWKGANYKIKFRPQNGITVRVRGKITLYQVKGELQLQVESLEPSGEGALRAAFEQIRARLENEGLFAPEIKRPIPFLPRRVGVVTSKTGAAFHDIKNVLTRRARSVSILLIPTLVQGEAAADNIRQAVEDVNRFNFGLSPAEKIDVLIVGRGGGSAEDLWAFNDERLARTLRASSIPVISAVGHEIDWTIADMAADVRASTPSAAAEIVAAREEDILYLLHLREGKLTDLVNIKMAEAIGRVEQTEMMIREVFRARLLSANNAFSQLAARLSPVQLNARISDRGHVVGSLLQRQSAAISKLLTGKTERFNVGVAKLDTLSPLSVLHRGFSITQNASGRILRDPSDVNPGEKLKIRLEKGKLNAVVSLREEDL